MNRHAPRPLPTAMRQAWLLLPLFSLLPASLQAQTTPVEDEVPELRVPVLSGSGGSGTPGMDPRILERDRSGGVPTGTGESGSMPGSGGSGSGFPGGGQASVPAPRSASNPGGASGDGNFDVNVSVSGGPGMPTLNIPSLPGMPGASGSSGSPGMPGTTGSASPGSMPGSMPGSSGSTAGMPGMPGQSGSQSGRAGSPGSQPGAGSEGRDEGQVAGTDGGSQNGNGNDGSSSAQGQGSGDMAGTGNAGGGQEGSGTGGSGASGTVAGTGTGGMGGGMGRVSVLDERLNESFRVFDGMIIGERERAQQEADAAGAAVMGTGGGGAGEGEGEDGRYGEDILAGVLVAGGSDNSTGGGILPAGGRNREGEFSHSEQALYPVPEDIPDGNDDDVVARQLREAAMAEADPELRERLWDEYRRYTGLPIPDAE